MQVKVPELAEGVREAIITLWHVKEGDKIEKGQDIVEMATDKATFNMPSPESGTLKKILRQEGDTVKVGETIVEIA